MNMHRTLHITGTVMLIMLPLFKVGDSYTTHSAFQQFVSILVLFNPLFPGIYFYNLYSVSLSTQGSTKVV